jgi:hypothetical protein
MRVRPLSARSFGSGADRRRRDDGSRKPLEGHERRAMIANPAAIIAAAAIAAAACE